MDLQGAEGTAQKKRLFLDALCETGSITEAAVIAHISRRTAYKWKKSDPDFKRELEEECRQIGLDALEDEAVRRGRHGVDEAVYYRGEVCGTVRKYSDTLLMFMLNAGRPEKFKRPAAETPSDTAVNITGGLPDPETSPDANG